MKINYLKRKKRQKKLLLIQEELVFIEPFYQLISQYETWFLENRNFLKRNSYEQKGKDWIRGEYISKLFLELTNQLTEMKRIVDNYKGNIDIAFFKDYIDEIDVSITNDDKSRIMHLMFCYSEILERSKSHEKLKKEEEALIILRDNRTLE